jgi:hypothetical protein
LEKIQKVKSAGFKHWFLSYVQTKKDVDEFRKLVGPDAIVNLKIEDKQGLAFVQREFVKEKNTNLVAARGDMYVELDRPHEILDAVQTIVNHDPDAICGSRLLLSTVTDAVPSCADWHELAWLYDIGYRNMMLCDELCLKDELLTRAVNAFQAFKNSYHRKAKMDSIPLRAPSIRTPAKTGATTYFKTTAIPSVTLTPKKSWWPFGSNK